MSGLVRVCVCVCASDGKGRTLCVGRDRALAQTTVGRILTRLSERGRRKARKSEPSVAHTKRARD